MKKIAKVLAVQTLVLMILISSGCVKEKDEATLEPRQRNLTGYVNPFIGADQHGHTFPGATLPFGMVQLSPDTGIEGWDWCSGYHYSDSSIMGFSHTHLSGTGCGDYGNILFMPLIGRIKTEPGPKTNPDEGYRSRFDHERELAEPGYYSVLLKDYEITAELTATKRAGFHRYTFPNSNSGHILIDLSHRIRGEAVQGGVNVVNNHTIEGYSYCDPKGGGWCASGAMYTVYFAAEFNKPFSSYGVWKDNRIYEGRDKITGPKIGAFVDYKTTKGEQILVKVGISFTSIKDARKNLEVEIPNWGFNEVRSKAKNDWNKKLNKIDVESGSENDLTTFYTALYHTMIAPNTFSDVDGSYTGMDKRIHSSSDHAHYSIFSIWDTFRAEHPLLVLLEPEKDSEMIESLLDKYDQGGYLPIWELASSYTNCMIGDHATSVIADAYLKGLEGFDIEKAYAAIKKGAMDLPPKEHTFKGRVGLNYYKKLGYLPANRVGESVSRTLEYTYDDWCVAQVAKALGKTEDYEYFMGRSLNYRNLFNPSNGFFQGKKEKGPWVKLFDPRYIGGDRERLYTEGNAWQYLWSVQHDVQGLIDLMGGEGDFIEKLDHFFKQPSIITGPAVPDVTGMIGQYAHGNEPSHHIPYLYDYAGQPWKTQERVRQIMDTLYHANPGGLCGNEDVGQMSAWYVFSAMGFYPACPGMPAYAIGSPVFDRVTVHLDEYWGSNELIITAENNSPKNKYIQSVTLNGKPLNKPWITHEDVVNGGVLVFEMGPSPNKKWGT